MFGAPKSLTHLGEHTLSGDLSFFLWQIANINSKVQAQALRSPRKRQTFLPDVTWTKHTRTTRLCISFTESPFKTA